MISRIVQVVTCVLALSTCISGCASVSNLVGTSWQEEVLLHDGSKIIVDRSVKRGGRHEIGQQGPISQQNLTFTLPITNERITWKSEFSKDVGLADLQPMLLDVSQGSAYVVTTPVGCLAYNKWGRPNPPYVVFKYESKEWKRIALQDLPGEIKTPNIMYGSPDSHVEKLGTNFVKAEDVQKINSELRQPEYRSILREKVTPKAVGSSVNCEEMIRYKCGWGAPGEFSRKYFERICN